MNIMIVGVGGQGTLLASRVLGRYALNKNFDVKVSEVHGMSQRGGSVVTYVKYDEKVNSPIIDKGDADIILAFEKLEGYRWMSYIKDGGELILNTQEINPMPVIIGNAEYPQGIEDTIRSNNINLTAVDALTLAKGAGSMRAVNIVLLGVMVKVCGFNKDEIVQAIKDVLPPKILDINMKAFEYGYSCI